MLKENMGSDMDQEEKQYYIDRHGPGRVSLEECELCGMLTRRKTDTRLDDDVVVEESMSMMCDRCNLVRRRAPEVFDFVSGVAAKLKRSK